MYYLHNIYINSDVSWKYLFCYILLGVKSIIKIYMQIENDPKRSERNNIFINFFHFILEGQRNDIISNSSNFRSRFIEYVNLNGNYMLQCFN